jgi:hypothetical protein
MTPRLALAFCTMVLALGCGGHATGTGPAAPTSPITANGPPDSPPSLAGAYQMTFSADAACSALPEAARTRTYGAIVSASLVTLTGATFGLPGVNYNWHTLYARFAGDDVQLYFQDPPIWELLSPSQYVVIDGLHATGSVRALPATLPFEGEFVFCADAEPDEYPECRVPEIVCRSDRHRLVITRP